MLAGDYNEVTSRLLNDQGLAGACCSSDCPKCGAEGSNIGGFIVLTDEVAGRSLDDPAEVDSAVENPDNGVRNNSQCAPAHWDPDKGRKGDNDWVFINCDGSVTSACIPGDATSSSSQDPKHGYVDVVPIDFDKVQPQEINKDKDPTLRLHDEEAIAILRLPTDEILALDPKKLELLCKWLAASAISGSKAFLEALQERQQLQEESEKLEQQILETRKRRANSFGFIGRMLFEIMYAAPSRSSHA
jgi:hypothetical protein